MCIFSLLRVLKVHVAVLDRRESKACAVQSVQLEKTVREGCREKR